MTQRATVVYVLTSHLSYVLLRGQLQYVQTAGFRVVLVTGTPVDSRLMSDSDVEFLTVPMKREIAPLDDLLSLLRLWRLLRRLRPQITNVSTPKAGFLAGIAAVLARVPCRIYTLRGLRFETARSAKRNLLIAAEYLACWCAHQVIAVSQSLGKEAIRNGLSEAKRLVVFGEGSSNGVDVVHFDPARVDACVLSELRQSLRIPAEAPVVGFVGRFTHDKGFTELIAAYELLKHHCPDLRLLLVGDYENEDPISPELRRRVEADPQIVLAGFVADTAPYYALMDVLALPTHREGFPNAVLEAQAAAKPVVTTRATGAVDSIENGITGLLIPVGNREELTNALRTLLSDPQLRRTMGEAGRARVKEHFRQEIVWNRLVTQYRAMLEQRCSRNPSWRWEYVAKRGMDLVAASLGLVLLSPVMLFLAFLIAFTMGRPILFRQARPGFHARPFSLLKFRTMREPNLTGNPLADADRLSSLGKWIRKTSLDELPQLWNVLRGEMSLVGPRPLLMEYLPRYTAAQARRHDMKPGMTGLSQVSGRNLLSWEDKFRLDTEYVDHWSLWLDLQILAKTFAIVLTGKGVSAADHVSAPTFMGTNAQQVWPSRPRLGMLGSAQPGAAVPQTEATVPHS